MEDLEKCIKSLVDIYAYLFVDYFSRHPFGEINEIKTCFSLLPPVIRYITLNELYSKDKKNIFIIDKLSLAILKYYNKEKAIEFIEENTYFLKTRKAVSDKMLREYKDNPNDLENTLAVENAPYMYDCLIERINAISDDINKTGLPYKSLEESIRYYTQNRGNFVEFEEFLLIMDFVYLGRKST